MHFDTDMEAATYLGKRYRMRDGEPQDYPLSGEWSGGATPQTVIDYVTGKGFPAPEEELEFNEWVQELCDSFEAGYYA